MKEKALYIILNFKKDLSRNNGKAKKGNFVTIRDVDKMQLSITRRCIENKIRMHAKIGSDGIFSGDNFRSISYKEHHIFEMIF